MSSGEDSIRVLIVDDIPETRENLKKMLYFESDMEIVGTAASGEEAIEVAKDKKPHIVLMDINMPGLDGITASEAITREVPYAQIVMMSVQSEADYLRRSMLAGARDFLTKPFTMDELISTVRRVYEMHAKPASLVQQRQVDVVEEVAVGPSDLGKLIAVYSPKGGVGCTTIAINLATMLCQLEPEAKVALVDCSFQFGDVGISMNLRATRSIVDLTDSIDELDADLIDSTLVTDDRSGLKTLLAPPKPEMAELVTVEHVRRIIERMQRMYDYIIVDMGSRLQDMELSLFDMADKVVLLIVPGLPAIKDARYFFELMEALEYPDEKTLLVLNMADTGSGISARAIESNIKHEVFAEIPNDQRIVPHSINHGIPYVLNPSVDKRLPLVVATQGFAEKVLQVFEQVVEEDDGGTDDRALGRLFR
jgi:pilus assembly protein CpaE